MGALGQGGGDGRVYFAGGATAVLFYSQLLAKILRGQAKDVLDVPEMLDRGLVEPGKAWELYEAIEGRLLRHPNIDPASFRAAVSATLGRR